MKLEYKIKPDSLTKYPQIHSVWSEVCIEDIDTFEFNYDHYNLRIGGVIYHSESEECLAAMEIYRIWYYLSRK